MPDCIKKIFRFGMVLYIAAVFFMIAPAHHHENGAKHNDCILCVLGAQSFIAQSIIALALTFAVIFAEIILLFFSELPLVPESFNSRAPPLI
jgi:hypothetical protein